MAKQKLRLGFYRFGGSISGENRGTISGEIDRVLAWRVGILGVQCNGRLALVRDSYRLRLAYRTYSLGYIMGGVLRWGES